MPQTNSARLLFPTIHARDWRAMHRRELWIRNEARIALRQKLTPGKIYLLRKDGL